MIVQTPPIEIKAPPEDLLTGEQALALGLSEPYELVEGKVVIMSPTKHRHGKYEYRLAALLGRFVDERHLGEVQVGEVGIYVQRHPDTVRAADVLFISRERLARATPDSFLDVAPELVAEIVSPDDRWSELRRKLREYFAAGVKVALVVEPEAQMLTVYRAPTEAREYTLEETLTLEDVLPGFSLAVRDLFA